MHCKALCAWSVARGHEEWEAGSSRGYGWSDLQVMDPVKPHSLFRIASISKCITAVAIMRLIEEGKLSLEDHAFELLDIEPVPARWAKPDPRLKQIKIQHLLNHTGGWDRSKSGDNMFLSVRIANALGVGSSRQARAYHSLDRDSAPGRGPRSSLCVFEPGLLHSGPGYRGVDGARLRGVREV